MADLHHRVPIEASPAKVYAAVSTGEGNRGWWTADSKVDPRVAGKAQFGFGNRGTVFNMTVDKLTPNKEVVMSCHGDDPEWAGTALTWKIEQEGKQTFLRFTHSGWKSMTDYCATCNSMWGQLMFRLKRYAESGNPDPQWKE